MRLLLRILFPLSPILIVVILLVVAWQSKILVDHHQNYSLREGMWPTLEEERTFLELRHSVLRISYGEQFSIEEYQNNRNLAFNRARIIREMSQNDTLVFSSREISLVEQIAQQIQIYKEIDQNKVLDHKTATLLLPVLDELVGLSHELLNRRRDVAYDLNYITYTHIEKLIFWIIVAIIVIMTTVIAMFILSRKESMAQQNLAISRDRFRIASELHDIMSYHLAIISQKLTRAQKHLPTNPSVTSIEIQEATGQTRLALADTRASIYAIRKGNIQPLENSIRELSASTIKIVVTVVGSPRTLPTEIAFTGYRIAQETIVNTLKHAHNATQITFILNYQPHYLALTIQDNGHPPIISEPFEPIQMGLIGMRDRVEQLGGTLQCGATDAGFRIHAEIPTENNDAANPRPDR